jgi:dihydrofolate reductase
VLLFGRQAWEHFPRLWPTRTDPFSTAMNRMQKLVVTRGTPDVSAWSNSAVLDGELVPAATRLAKERDVVVIGSTSVVQELAAAGAVEEYRLITFLIIVGQGTRLFAPVELDLLSVEAVGSATLATYAAR